MFVKVLPSALAVLLALPVAAAGQSKGADVSATITVLPPEGAVRIVEIDIKPGSDPNAINLSEPGIIPVAILSAGDFDATTVDPLSILFGPAGATEVHNRGHIEDADGDGDDDMVLHFRTEETGIEEDDTEACLSGETVDGTLIEGCDAVVIVG